MRAQAVPTGLVALLLLGMPALVTGGVITGHDSTQPRGAAEGVSNSADQDLSPVIDGFQSAASRAAKSKLNYQDWGGMMMANAMRDPSFFATLSVANRDMIKLMNNLYHNPGGIGRLFTGKARDLTTFEQLLEFLELEGEGVTMVNGELQPQDVLPITADLCLRCHTPEGWLEGRSEPKTAHSPFLKGQFWGAEIIENPVFGSGRPRKADLSKASEAEMDGLQCDFCHRVMDNFKRTSNYDGSEMAGATGSFFVDRRAPFCNYPFKCDIAAVYGFLKTGEFCGSCHDVTNPLIRTRTSVDGTVPDDMPHPIERTYTEWYWSDYRTEKRCQDCHVPMKFQGAQTWMISPVLSELWGEVDRKWGDAPYGYDVPERKPLWSDAAARNRDFMRAEAAEMSIIDASADGGDVTVKIKIVNKTGHKLPTGFAEGRQMWLHVKAEDETGKLVFESGYMKDGFLVRDEYFNGTYRDDPGKTMIKVYEVESLASGYDSSVVAPGDEHFHFILMNNIVKDNRIPPKGFNKKAYSADGAFIVPHDPKDTNYEDGQHWDITPYVFTVPEGAQGKIIVTADLKYQTFSREYIEFLREHDTELTREHGGRARNLPPGPYENYRTWGSALYDLWKDKADMGPPVIMQTVVIDISPGSPGYLKVVIVLMIALSLTAVVFLAVRRSRST